MAKRATAQRSREHEQADFAEEIAQGIAHLREELKQYEERFGMTSEEFIKKWEAGEMEDNLVNNWWAHAVYGLKIAIGEILVDDEGKLHYRKQPQSAE